MLFDLMTISEIELSRSFDITDFISLLGARFDRLHATVIREFGPHGIYILAVFAAFLILILAIYIKSVLDTFRAADNEADETSPDGGLFYTSETSADEAIAEIGAFQNNREYEDTRPRIMPKMAEENITINNAERKKAVAEEREKEISRELVRSSETTDDILQLKTAVNAKNETTPLDWNKKNLLPAEEAPIPDSLHYKPKVETLDELICLIINMLGRNVNANKIAQALYQRNQGQNSMEDLIQMVYAVRDFISLCNAGRFDNLPERETLPLNNEALLHWAKGDNSECLSLLEHLIRQQIELAEKQNGVLQEITYAQAAEYACIFGTIATLNNLELAQNSFELAIELAPKNMNAWSRVGDIYWQLGNQEKAVFAYQTVLESSDNIIYAEQKANANRKLALYYTQIGKPLQAGELEQSSRKYYDDYGITHALTEQENAAYDLIAARRNDNLPDTVNRLLQNRQLQYS